MLLTCDRRAEEKANFDFYCRLLLFPFSEIIRLLFIKSFLRFSRLKHWRRFSSPRFVSSSNGFCSSRWMRSWMELNVVCDENKRLCLNVSLPTNSNPRLKLLPLIRNIETRLLLVRSQDESQRVEEDFAALTIRRKLLYMLSKPFCKHDIDQLLLHMFDLSVCVGSIYANSRRRGKISFGENFSLRELQIDTFGLPRRWSRWILDLVDAMTFAKAKFYGQSKRLVNSSTTTALFSIRDGPRGVKSFHANISHTNDASTMLMTHSCMLN